MTETKRVLRVPRGRDVHRTKREYAGQAEALWPAAPVFVPGWPRYWLRNR